MKAKSFLFSMLAAATLVGCSSDDVLEEVGGGQVSADNKAYVAIRLVSPTGISSRGAVGTPEFQDGAADENKVSSVDFYFFKGGKFDQVKRQQLSWSTSGPNANVEKISDAVIALDGIKDKKNAPDQVVAVLNGEQIALDKGSDIQNLLKKTTQYKNGDYFVMSNSTYYDGEKKVDATTIPQENILNEAPKPDQLTNANAVTMYVERLAAKATIGFNNLDPNKIKIGSYEVDGKPKDLFIKILGWNLNGTSKQSYLVKQVPVVNDEAISKTDFVWNWNDPANHRSYWAKSFSYNESNSLNHISFEEANIAFDKAAYCNETTNTTSVLQANFNKEVTHALITAQLISESESPSTEKQELIRYQGTLYANSTNFIARVLNEKGFVRDGFEVYKEKKPATGTDKEYVMISTSDLKLALKKKGEISLELKDPATVWYTKSTSSAGTVEMKEYDMKNVFADVKAEYYKEGMMHYIVPIEHFRPLIYEKNATSPKLDFNSDGKPVISYIDEFSKPQSTDILEGQYGVVRNHWYKLTINSIKNLGEATHNPGELIIPSTKPKTYYIGAQINILSWKTVNQDVEL